MKAKHIVFSLFLILYFFKSYATDDSDNEKFFSSNDIISIFGKTHFYNRNTGSSISINPGNIKTNMQCGQIQVDILNNFNQALSDLKQMPQKLVDQFSTNFSSLAAASPIIALCYSSPTLCAELKNLNLNLQQDVGLQTNMCQSIDNYVTDRSDQGRKESYDRALKSCIAQFSPSMGVRNATYKCNSSVSENDVLVADVVNNKISNGLKTTQNIIQSALTSTGSLVTQNDLDRYKLLKSSLGDMQIATNGSITPAFGDLKLTPNDMSENVMNNSQNLVCNLNNLKKSIDGKPVISPSNDVDRYLQTILNQTINKNLSDYDVSNLQDLDFVDKEVICNSLARSLALETIKNVVADNSNALDSVTSNAVIPDDIKSKIVFNANKFFTSVIKTSSNEDIVPVPIIKKELSKLAYLSRDSKRKLGVALTTSEISEAVQRSKNCDSAITCE
jgi:hypothetical protein